MPERLQLSRRKGFRLPPFAKSVARPSRWGNPFRVGDDVMVHQYPDGRHDGFGCSFPLTQRMAVELFREWVLARPEQVQEIRRELAGLHLACWCPIGTSCHADVLLEVANA